MSELLAPAPANQAVTPNTEGADACATDDHAESNGAVSSSPFVDKRRYSVKDVEGQVAMATRRAARFVTFAEVDNVGPEAITQLRDDVVHLANTYLRKPLATITGDLIETQDLIFQFLEGRQRPTLTRDLYVLGAVVSGMISKASQDLGRMHEAMTHARTLYVCADKAGHTGLQAWARGQQALIAFRAGRPQESARYALAGEEIAAHLSGSVTVWLPSLRARALAQMSAPGEAREAIGQALDRRNHIRRDDLDEIGGLLTFPQAKQHYYAAGAYVFLGDADADAEREAQTALDLYESSVIEERPFASEAGARTELALARVHGGRLDGARDALSDVLTLAPERRIGGILQGLRHVHQALQDSRYVGSIAARDLRESIETFGQTPASALAS
jgi:tetratricopeptide (TPR) repeat protein